MKRIISLSAVLILTLVLFRSFPSVMARNLLNAEQYSDGDILETDEKNYLLNPETGQYLEVNNIETHIATLSAMNERDAEFERLFEKQRAADKEAYKLFYYGNHNVVPFSVPIMGGLGYGAYYKSSFQSGFISGTTVSYDVICPTHLGGDVSNYLYLTGTNRAAKGAEALISYYAQSNPCFKIYDWARPASSRWQTCLSYSQLSDYLTTKTINGVSRQIITIQNSTIQISSSQWRNVVFLTNYSNNCFDQVYSYDYSATLTDQQDSYYGSYAAIVETFQTSFNQDLNIVGFNLVYVKGKTAAYTSTTWGAWQLLTSSVSTAYNGNVGLSLVFNSPNYTFGVK